MNEKGQNLNVNISCQAALQHLWIIQHLDHYDDTLLSAEYAWSHRCCNQVKNDTIFMYAQWDNGNYELVIDDNAIMEFQIKLQNKIYTPGGIDCHQLQMTMDDGESPCWLDDPDTGIEPVVDYEKLTDIKKICDENINSLKDESKYHGFSEENIEALYMLLMKFKVISTFKDDKTFTRIILDICFCEQNAAMSNKNSSEII